MRLRPLAGPCPCQTRFRCASGCDSLRLATKMNSQTHSPKGTPSGLAAHHPVARGHRPPLALRLFVGIRFQVLFHSASSRTFHLSLTVLVHYRSSSVFSLGGWTPRLPTGLACPVVLRIPTGARLAFVYGTGTLCGWLFNTIQLTTWLVTPICRSYNPGLAPRRGRPVWADPRSLATTSGIISFPAGT